MGTGEVDLVNTSPTPQFLALDPHETNRLALISPSWSDGRGAIVGMAPNGAISVWVDRPGRLTLKFNWSAAGVMEFGERRFELRLPHSVSSELELELPIGQRPSAPSDLLLTGPFPLAGEPGRAAWRFRFGERPRVLNLAIRQTTSKVVTASSALAAQFEIAPGQVTTTFEYDLRPARVTAGEWLFSVDPGLRITGVVINNLAKWSIEPTAAPGGSRLLRIELNQPSVGGRVVVSAVAVFPDSSRPADSPLPFIRPVGALLDEETLEIRISPEMKPDKWSPGDYRLTDSQILTDQSRIIRLYGTLLPAGADRLFRQPPTLGTAPTDSEYVTTEQVAWRFDRDRAMALVRLGLRIQRGPLFRIVLRTPAGYSFVRVTSPHDDLIASATFGGGAVTVDFTRPLLNGQGADLSFEFRGPSTGPNQFVFPAFTPLGAVERSGVLGVAPGLHWRVETSPGVGMTPVGWFDFSQPAVPVDSVVAFRYRGGDPVGRLTLTPVKPEASVQILGATDSPSASELTPHSTVPATENEWAFSDLYLLTAVHSEHDIEVVFGGTVASAGGSRLPVALPGGAQVLSTSVAMHSVERGPQQLSPEGLLTVPLPGSGPTRFEIRYRLPVDVEGTTRIRSPEPGLPGPGMEIPRWWMFDGTILPGWPVHAWDRCKSTELPSLLGAAPIAGSAVVCSRTPSDEVLIGLSKTATFIGIILSIALFFLSWIGSFCRHSSCAIALIGLVLVLGIIAIVGPPWWQRMAFNPLAIGTLAGAGMVLARQRRSLGTLSSGLLILVLFSHGDSIAQAPAPATVVILPADADGVEKVVVPKALLDRLAAVSQPIPPGVVVTSADYVLTQDENTARVTAKLTVFAWGDANLNAMLPLSEARLERVSLNGEKVVDTVQRAGVYTIPLLKAGRHEIEIRFAVPIAGTGTERELRFGIPECPATRITADFPTTARQIQLVGRIGKQTALEGTPKRLALDAGSLKAIHFRWRDGVGSATAFKVREACLWDVSEKGAELTACYITRIDQGTVSSLRYELPAELEPVEVSIRPLDINGEAALRDWSMGVEQGGMRQLRLDLQGPTSGRMLTVVNCRFKKAVTLQPVLRFPKPVIPGGNSEPDVIYGLRVNALRSKDTAQKLTVEGTGIAGAIDYDAERLLKDKEWSEVSALRLSAAAPIRVFRPTPTGTTELRPTFRRQAEQPDVILATTWQVEPHQAQANGTIRWSGKDPLSLVELTIPGPGIRLQEIQGPEVATWKQAGARVLVWLRRASAAGEVEWLGIAHPLPQASTPANPFPFDAVVPHVHDAKHVSEIVRVQPAIGWKARVDRDRGWTSVGQSEESLNYQSSSTAAMPVRILLSPDSRPAPARISESVRPTPRPQGVIEAARSGVAPRANPSNENSAKPEVPTSNSTVWLLPVMGALAWGGVVAILALLQLRFPQTTWPEQFGLAIGLFGAAIVGHWWFGLVGWALMRAFWLVQIIQRPQTQDNHHQV